MTAINYSIIIPHYNTPSLLARLLSSIPQREDVEVIVVDDNSDDNKVDFESFPGKERNNVKLFFDKKGGGGGYARNLGLSHAIGKWVIFADSDDFFNYCINDILDQYVDSSFDIIYFKSNSLDSEYYTSSDRDYFTNRHIPIKSRKDENYLRYLYGEPWGKIIRRSVIEEFNIRFDEVPIHNDTTFSYLVGFHAKEVYADERAMYCVTYRNNSVSKARSFEKSLVRINVFGRAELFYEKNKLNVTPIFELPYRQLLKFILDKDKFKLGCCELKNLGYSEKKIILGLSKVSFLVVLRKILSLLGREHYLN